MDIRVWIIAAAEVCFGLYLLYRLGALTTARSVIASALLLAGAMVIRLAVIGYETLDYQDFLTHWVQYFRDNGGFRALRASVGNYNIPYLYFLALFSLSGIRDLYLIKLLSILFDIILAFAAAWLVKLVKGSGRRVPACFFAVLILPTVFLNGALWGQCDSVYVAFALLGICFALDDRPVLAMVMMAVSFGFKLQAVFVMPVFIVLWMMGKLRLKHFFVFPAAYVLLVLPAVLLGRPFIETLTLYISQSSTVGSGLNYNSPSIFAFFRSVPDEAAAAEVGIIAAFAFMLCVFCAAFLRRKRLRGRDALIFAALLAAGIPLLLPHMHDRYFFAADVLMLALAFAEPICIPAAVLTQFASLLGYHAYLKMRYLLPMRYGTVALIISLALCVFALYGRSGSDVPSSIRGAGLQNVRGKSCPPQ